VECWGENSYGELGDGSTTDSTLPVQVSGLGGGDGGDAIVAITAGDFNTCALTSAGGVKCWGQVLGSHTPTDVPGLSSGVTAVAVGPTQICAMTTSGSVLCQSGGSSPATAVPGFP
jgi:alpha-tubulin suppressor-like RCC1 family protein